MEETMSMGPGVDSIDVTEAERRMREDPEAPLLIDVREQYEFDELRAPGAVLMPMSSFAERLGELPPGRPLMIVCHMGSRSAAVAGFLARSGRPDVVNVAGGMDAWQRQGLPVKRGTPEPGEGDLPG
jgi:rhodanese-related sulfurtransferase